MLQGFQAADRDGNEARQFRKLPVVWGGIEQESGDARALGLPGTEAVMTNTKIGISQESIEGALRRQILPILREGGQVASGLAGGLAGGVRGLGLGLEDDAACAQAEPGYVPELLCEAPGQIGRVAPAESYEYPGVSPDWAGVSWGSNSRAG